MRFSATSAALATVIGLSSAMPTAPEADAPAAPASTPAPYYYFKTVSQDPAKPQYNDLYLTAYHTGAGLSDATFVRGDPLAAHRGILVGDALSWFAPDPNGVAFGLQYQVGGTNYAAWSPVTINGGAGSPGLQLLAGKLTAVSPQFDSWLVCDWHHSAPQLFVLAKYGVPIIPSSCAKIDLVAEVSPGVITSPPNLPPAVPTVPTVPAPPAVATIPIIAPPSVPGPPPATPSP